MAQTKDPILIQMRTAATAKHLYDDFPSQIALLASMDYWSRRDDAPFLIQDFIQILFNRELFELSFEKLADKCHYCEKALRLHCRKYVDRFLNDFKYINALPLPALVSRYTEFCQYSPLRADVMHYRTFSLDEIPILVSAYSASQEDKELSLQIYNHSLRNCEKIAG